MPRTTVSYTHLDVYKRQADGCDDGGGKFGWRDGGRRVATTDGGMEKSHGDDDQQGAEKQIGRDEEDDAGIADSAHVDHCEQQQDDEADLKGVRLQPGHGRNERAHARGDPDRGGEDVVNHERRGGEQACAIAEILTCDGERATPVRIGFDRLGVGEVEDDEQDEDGGGDGEDEVNACQAERDEYCLLYTSRCV